MGFIPKGVTKLSELEIDADKDWVAKGISNIKEVAESMETGAIVVHDGSVLIKLSPGVANLVLTSEGPGHLPVWAPGGTYYHRYFPVSIYLSHAEAAVSVDQSHSESASASTQHKEAYLDAPSDYIKRLLASVALSDTETAGITPDKDHNENAPVTRKYDLEIVVGGAAAQAGAVFTDETTEAQNPTADDMILPPAVPALNDAYYLGHTKQFDVGIINIGVPGSGVWTITWEYWNGAWVALGGVTDGTTHFMAAVGKREVSFTRPGDWATTNEGGDLPANIYWIRGRVSAYTSIITQPKGTQAWIRIIT